MKTPLCVLALVGVFGCWIPGNASAAVLGITDMVLSPDPGTGTITNSTLITSFSTSLGTYTDLQGAVTSSGTLNPYWGNTSTVFPGQGSLTGSYGLDVAYGSLGISTDVGYGTNVDSAAVFFMTDAQTGTQQDDVTILPLDMNGNPIGDFSLSLFEADWGAGLDLFHMRASGVNVSNARIRGITFSLSDFSGTGILSGVYGLRVTSPNADPSVIGYAVTAIPEPSSYALVAAGFLLLACQRRMRCPR